MSWKTPKRYYVYTYLDSNGTPYYVGMGKGRRAVEKHIYVEVPEIINIIIQDDMTQEDAWKIETQLIEHYGMKCKNEGPLLNLQKGGKTQKSGWHHSTETKEQISKSLTGVKKKTTINYKKPKSAEHAEAIRQANIGRPDDGRYKKIGEKMSKKRWYNKDGHTVMCEPGKELSGYLPGRGKLTGENK